MVADAAETRSSELAQTTTELGRPQQPKSLRVRLARDWRVHALSRHGASRARGPECEVDTIRVRRLFHSSNRPHLQETWSAFGVGRMLGGATRLDVAYMFRTRSGSGGEVDHVLWAMVFFGVPARTKTSLPSAQVD